MNDLPLNPRPSNMDLHRVAVNRRIGLVLAVVALCIFVAVIIRQSVALP